MITEPEDTSDLWGEVSGSDPMDVLLAFFAKAQAMSIPLFAPPTPAALRDMARLGILTEAEYEAILAARSDG